MTGTTTLILLKVASIEKLRRWLRLLVLGEHVRHGLGCIRLRRQEHLHLLWRHHGHLLGWRLHLVMRIEAKVVLCLLLWLHWHSVHVNVVTNVKSLRAARLSVDWHRWLLLLLSLLPVVVAFVVIMTSIAFRLELLLLLLLLLLLGLFLRLIIVWISVATLPLIFVLIVPILIVPIIRWGLILLKIIIVVSSSSSIVTLALLASALILLLLLIITIWLVELAIITTIITTIYFL